MAIAEQPMREITFVAPQVVGGVANGLRSRTHEGSGIGLALVQELAKLRGGSVRVESQLREGSTFIVSVPLEKAHLSPERVGGTLAPHQLNMRVIRKGASGAVHILAVGGKRGDTDGVGSVHRITWKTALPYQLTFDIRMDRIDPMSALEGRASGELDGVGLWTLRPRGAGTYVRYDWKVEVTKPWMKVFAPLLRPVFAWNHNIVMGWGEEDIRFRLKAAV
jgi:hypothetical protein